MSKVSHPFAELIQLEILEQRAGFSKMSLQVMAQHMNPQKVVHGAVVYALADTSMGGALHTSLGPGQFCATVEIKINYFKPIFAGRLVCIAETVNRGKTLANMEAKVFLDDTLVANANGNFAIFTPRAVPPV